MEAENSIKHIVKKTHYWLFKKTIIGEYYFIRTMNEGLDSVVWFIGYENQFGLVSPVGGELEQERQKQLEIEFQSSN